MVLASFPPHPLRLRAVSASCTLRLATPWGLNCKRLQCYAMNSAHVRLTVLLLATHLHLNLRASWRNAVKVLFKDDKNRRPIALCTEKPTAAQVEWCASQMSTRSNPIDPSDLEVQQLEQKEGSPFKFMLATSNLVVCPV